MGDETDADEDVVLGFDKKIATIWIVIALGATKSLESLVVLAAEHGVTVTVAGVDVTLFALYFLICTAGTTALVFWKATAGRVIDETIDAVEDGGK